VNQLEKWCRIYQIPATEDFYDLYEDGMYDLAVLDEFKASKTIQWLNLWLQGGMMNIRKKGAQVLKKENIPTIILSNYELHESYHKVELSKLETLESRLDIVRVSEFINIDWGEWNTPRVESEDESMIETESESDSDEAQRG